MLSKLVKKASIVHIAGKEFKIRMSLNALLYLETEYKSIKDILSIDFDKWNLKTCLHLLRAGFCDLPENRKAVSEGDFSAVLPSLADLGAAIDISDLITLRIELMHAVSDAFSTAKSAVNINSDEHRYYTGYGHLRAFYVDILGRPEEEFWTSTRKEIDERIDYYLEVKGEKEKAVIVQRYDS